MNLNFDFEQRMMAFADGDEWFYVPRLWDREDYRYSHGGKVYKDAVERFWELEQQSIDSLKLLQKEVENALA